MPTPEKKPINLYEEINKLNLPKDHFMIVGSGIMSLKGIRDSYDLDLVISEELFEQLKNGPDFELRPWTRTGIGREWLKNDIADLVVDMRIGDEIYDLQRLKLEGEKIDDMWFLSLKQLIDFKRVYGRQKDFDDIELIERYLLNHIK